MDAALRQLDLATQRLLDAARVLPEPDLRAPSLLPVEADKGNDMILSTMNDLPGYEITEVIGEVFGITVRSDRLTVS